METLLIKGCEQVERAIQMFAAERACIISTQFGPTGVTSPMNLPGVAAALVSNNTSNHGQQIMSASPSQQSISGHDNNQQMHSHMSFMPQSQPQAQTQHPVTMPVLPQTTHLSVRVVKPESHARQIFGWVSALALVGPLCHVDKDLLGWRLCE